MVKTVGIKAAGYYVPENIVENSYFKELYGITEDWITLRTGIEKRRKVSEGEATSDLAARAGKYALERAGMSPEELDCIILATSSPDMLFPNTASLVQDKLKARKAGAFDISVACSGFIYGLQIGYAMVASGLHKNVMVIGAEVLSRFMDLENKETAILFGDGAGCVILSPMENERNIIHCEIGADGKNGEILTLPAGGAMRPASEETVANKLHYIHMNGKETYKACTHTMCNNITEAMKKFNLTIDDVSYLIPHQGNKRIIEAVGKKLKISEEKVHVNVTYLGNTAAASIPIGLCECIEANKFKPEDIILLTTFGAGLTWGSCVIKW